MSSLQEIPRKPAHGGELNAAISNVIVGLLSEYAGRGPTKARTIHSGKLVLCVLEDMMTKAERSLSASGRNALVLDGRHALQDAMEEKMIAAVEGLTGRKVNAMMSTNHIEPDLAAEVFVLDEPLAEAAEALETLP